MQRQNFLVMTQTISFGHGFLIFRRPGHHYPIPIHNNHYQHKSNNSSIEVDQYIFHRTGAPCKTPDIPICYSYD